MGLRSGQWGELSGSVPKRRLIFQASSFYQLGCRSESWWPVLRVIPNLEGAVRKATMGPCCPHTWAAHLQSPLGERDNILSFESYFWGAYLLLFLFHTSILTLIITDPHPQISRKWKKEFKSSAWRGSSSEANRCPEHIALSSFTIRRGRIWICN